MTDEEVTVYGPTASVRMPLRVDTGARNTILEMSTARRLGIPLGPLAPISTYGKNVRWHTGQAYVATYGLEPVSVPIWVAPDGETPALGETAMVALGYKLVRPPANVPNMTLAGAARPGRDPSDSTDFNYSARRAVCDSCPHETSTLGISRCTLCGCPLQSKLRVSGPGGCPDGRW
ncbi:MAG: aspartyl protease family protein [Thermoplasmata archaeon]